MLEIDHTKSRADKQMTSSSLAIKEFVRSGAGRDLTQAHLLRPVHVLLETMGYLLNKYMIVNAFMFVLLPRISIC